MFLGREMGSTNHIESISANQYTYTTLVSNITSYFFCSHQKKKEMLFGEGCEAQHINKKTQKTETMKP